VKFLNLILVVLTSVARVDLPDHGANLFISTINENRKIDSTIKIEVLTPDLWGGGKNFDETNNLQTARLKMILEKDPICFNHNLETVERLQKEVRRGANYKKSLSLLKKSKDIAPHIQTKSGIMLGLGETLDEIKNTIYDLFNENIGITKMQLILFKFKYFSSRILDIIVTIFITDSLISIFANRNLFLFPIRKFSFLLLNNVVFIRKLVLNQMTKSLIYSRIK